MPTAYRRLRRCAALFLQPRERLTLDLGALLGGGNPLRVEPEWVALAPHLGREVALGPAAVLALGQIGESQWTDRAQIAVQVSEATLRELLDAGLLIEEGAEPAAEQALRAGWWHPLNALAHAGSRWSGTDSEAARREARFEAVSDLVAAQGAPPPHYHTRADAQTRCALPAPVRTVLDDLLARRATCRNFDPAAALPLATLSALLKRVFGAQGEETLAPGAVAVKKMSPSGGALHPLEAYLLVQRVEGLESGLYHYHVGAHALDRLRLLDAPAARALALVAVAGQDYFAAAPVLLVLSARFPRSHWKYRNHPKIYRAIVLEAGHLSQNLYLAATEHGLGAFITAAINEVELEQAFGLTPFAEGPLAVCGIGARAGERCTVEFDPQGAVWRQAAPATR